ncbi:hypothetical protein, partial [Escherichia coli]
SDPGPVFHTIVSIKNDGHYFCRAGGNRPDGLNEPVTNNTILSLIILLTHRGFAAIPPGTGKKISLMRMKLFMAIIKIMF